MRSRTRLTGSSSLVKNRNRLKVIGGLGYSAFVDSLKLLNWVGAFIAVAGVAHGSFLLTLPFIATVVVPEMMEHSGQHAKLREYALVFKERVDAVNEKIAAGQTVTYADRKGVVDVAKIYRDALDKYVEPEGTYDAPKVRRDVSMKVLREAGFDVSKK